VFVIEKYLKEGRPIAYKASYFEMEEKI